MVCLTGVCVQRDATTLEVTELPIRKWTQDYKEFLETLIKPEDKNAPALLEVNSSTCCSTSHKKCLVLLQPSLCIIPQTVIRRHTHSGHNMPRSFAPSVTTPQQSDIVNLACNPQRYTLADS